MTCDLTCPADAMLGDVALQLQKTALEAEDCIYSRELLLRTAVNRPTILTTSTALQAVGTGVETSLVAFGTPVNTFNNTLLSSPFNAWRNIFLQGGIFLCGATFNATAPTPASNTSRRTTIGLKSSSGLSPDFAQSVLFTQFETTIAGGIDICVAGVFGAPAGLFQGDVTFLHDNGSNVDIAAGLILWVTRLGDLTATRTI